jgi:hypothetical protein
VNLPIPANILTRLLLFLTPGAFGRIELDVQNGRVVQCRVIEVVKPEAEIVQLREPVAR